MSNSPSDWPRPILDMCPGDKWRDPKNNECTDLQKCVTGKWRNPFTNRCKNIKRLNPEERIAFKIQQKNEEDARNSDSDSESESESESEPDERELQIQQQLDRIINNPVFRRPEQNDQSRKGELFIEPAQSPPDQSRKGELFIEPSQSPPDQSRKGELFIEPSQSPPDQSGKGELFIEPSQSPPDQSGKGELFIEPDQSFVDETINEFVGDSDCQEKLQECENKIGELSQKITELMIENNQLKNSSKKEEAALKITSAARRCLACKKISKVREEKRKAKLDAKKAVQKKRREREEKKRVKEEAKAKKAEKIRKREEKKIAEAKKKEDKKLAEQKRKEDKRISEIKEREDARLNKIRKLEEDKIREMRKKAEEGRKKIEDARLKAIEKVRLAEEQRIVKPTKADLIRQRTIRRREEDERRRSRISQIPSRAVESIQPRNLEDGEVVNNNSISGLLSRLGRDPPKWWKTCDIGKKHINVVRKSFRNLPVPEEGDDLCEHLSKFYGGLPVKHVILDGHVTDAPIQVITNLVYTGNHLGSDVFIKIFKITNASQLKLPKDGKLGDVHLQQLSYIKSLHKVIDRTIDLPISKQIAIGLTNEKLGYYITEAVHGRPLIKAMQVSGLRGPLMSELGTLVGKLHNYGSHGDAHFSNFIVSPDKEDKISIIDIERMVLFEKLNMEDRLIAIMYDVAQIALALLRDGFFSDFSFFVKSYIEEMKLNYNPDVISTLEFSIRRMVANSFETTMSEAVNTRNSMWEKYDSQILRPSVRRTWLENGSSF